MKEFVSLALVLGLVVAWGGVAAWRLHRGYRSRSWPKAEAIIEASAVSRMSTLQATVWMPKVRYRYEVDGTWYRGERIAFESQLGTNPNSAARTCAKFVVGSRVAVYYDPKAPHRSVLWATISVSDIVFAASGVAAGLLMVLLMLPLVSFSDRQSFPHEGAFVGLYYGAFERSDFRQAGTKETWWLKGEVPCKRTARASDGRPLFYVEFQASLSERGSFGHLGAYDRQIVPTRFIACRHATAAEDKALFQDGSFAY